MNLAALCHSINRTPLDLTVEELTLRLHRGGPRLIQMPAPTIEEQARKARWRARYMPVEDEMPPQAGIAYHQPIGDETRIRITDLHAYGLKRDLIASLVKVSQTTVSRVLKGAGCR